MSTGLLSQLDDLYTHIDECQTPIGSDEVATMLASVRELPVATVAFDVEPRRPALWTGLAAAVLVLVLFGVMSLVTVTSDTDAPPATDPPPATTATSPPTTTAASNEEPQQAPWSGLAEDIPEGVESGIVSTSAGSARWVHLNSDEYVLPSPGLLTNNAVAHNDYQGFVVQLPTGVWKADDAITWRWEPNSEPGVPDRLASYSLRWTVPYVDGAYSLHWFINTDPLEIEYSEGARGDGPDLSGLIPPESDGFTWTLDVSKPLSRNTVKGEAAQDVLHVRFSGPDDQVDQRLLVIERSNPGDRATYLNVPWDVDSVVSLFGTSETLFAYVGDPTSNQVLVWRSNDGYDWTESGGLHEQLSTPASSSLELTVLPAIEWPMPMRNQVVIATTPGHGWESTDGINWTRAPDGFPRGSDLVRLESGWFATDGDAWWMHLGDSWVSLAGLGMENTQDGCQVVSRGAGQTTLFFSTGMCTPDSSQPSTTDLWIIDVNS